MYPIYLQLRFESAVANYVKKHGEKPSLLQINRSDYSRLLPHEADTRRFGLAIRGVTTVGLEDIPAGQYHLLP